MQGVLLRRLRKTTKVDSDMQKVLGWSGDSSPGGGGGIIEPCNLFGSNIYKTNLSAFQPLTLLTQEKHQLAFVTTT